MSDETSKPWQERLKSPLTWHYAVLGVLAVLVIVLGVRLGMDWSATNGNSADALAAKQAQLKAMEVQTAPLRGLEAKVAQSRQQIDAFYARRVPVNYSAVAEQIGKVEVASGVRLSRVAYTPAKPNGDLTEVLLDVGVSGDYPQIMRFVNGLERDQTFFVIRAMSLTGQQGGQVNLRMRVSTWLRAADAAALPATESTPGPTQPAGEGQ